ncbi:MAG: rRNA maturation RNase YbeY [Thermodesulfobacteriota bacterium]
MKIWISNRQRKTVLSQENLRKKAATILDALGWSKGELSLTLINDRAMARLNRATFGRRGPTNVIAFPLDAEQSPSPLGLQHGAASPPPAGPSHVLSEAGPPQLLGEVVISLETTRRQAQELGWPWPELLDFFVIHGILHLLGYDHKDPAAEADMNSRAWELMSVLYPGRRWDQEF